MTNDKDRPGKDETEDMRKAVEERIEEEARAYPEDPESSDHEVSSSFIEQCLNANELGPGLLYAALLRDRFIFNTTRGEWYRWKGHTWEIDEGESHLAAIEVIVDRLLEELEILSGRISWAIKKKDDQLKSQLESQRKNIIKQILKLRNDHGRFVTVKFARTCKDPLTIKGKKFDLHPWLLGCANGVIDLRSGKFRDGRPSDYISVASPVEWKSIDEPAEQWEKFLLEIFDNDNDLVAYIQRLFGYGITGLNVEHILPVFWGKGRNGKGVLVEVINHVMGPLSGSIQSELLLDQRRPRSSAGPSPDIIGLKGLRLAFASETDEGQRFSTARVKWLTGGDQLVGRNPHEKYEIRFMPTHTLFLMTNNKPHTAGDDFAFWERLHLVHFHLSFVDREPMRNDERPAEKNIAARLKTEASGILAWLVMGCLQYQKEGLNPPEVVLKATAEYKSDEDLLGEFVEACCNLGPLLKIKASIIYDCFAAWHTKNVSKRVPGTRTFSKMLLRRFERRNEHNYRIYSGVDLNEYGESLLDEDTEG